MAHRGPRRVSATSGEDSCESSPLQLAGRSRVTRVQRVLSEETLEAVSSDPRRENGRLRQLLRVENAALAKIKDRVTQDVGSILYGTGRRRGWRAEGRRAGSAWLKIQSPIHRAVELALLPWGVCRRV